MFTDPEKATVPHADAAARPRDTPTSTTISRGRLHLAQVTSVPAPQASASEQETETTQWTPVRSRRRSPKARVQILQATITSQENTSRPSKSLVLFRCGRDIFPFLELPREIRDQTYEAYIADNQISPDTKIHGLITLRHVQQPSLHSTVAQVYGDQRFIQINRQIASEFVEMLRRIGGSVTQHLFFIASPGFLGRLRLQHPVVTDVFSRLESVRRLVISIGLSQGFGIKHDGPSRYPSWPGLFDSGSADILTQHLAGGHIFGGLSDRVCVSTA